MVVELTKSKLTRIVRSGRDGRGTFLLRVVDEVAPRSVRTEPYRVEGSAQLGLVFGVSGEVPQLVQTVSKLTLFSILAAPTLLKRSAKFGLVPTSVVLAVLLLLLLVLLVLVVYSRSHHRGRGVHGHGNKRGHRRVVHLEVRPGKVGVRGQR